MNDSGSQVPCCADLFRREAAECSVSRLLSSRFSSHSSPVIIAVGGPGGTGKSTLCRSLADMLSECVVLSLDDYRRPRAERQALALLGSHPDANAMGLLRDHICSLKQGCSIDKPMYNTVTGEVVGTEAFYPAQFVLLDGEISIYDALKDLIDFSIYLDADWRTQLDSRLKRDVDDHQFTPEKAIATFLQSNIRDAREFGTSGKDRADVRLFRRADFGVELKSVSTDLSTDLEPPPRCRESDLTGLVVPMTTPFTEDLSIDEGAFVRHLTALAESGVERVLICGTLGEFFSLSPAECRILLRLARRHFTGTLFFQAGRENTFQTIDAARMAEDNGADALLVITPYYYSGVGEQGLIDYFQGVAAQVTIPFMMYNFTRHTQNTLTAKVLSAVNHFGLKDSDANLNLIQHTPRYYLGSDTGMVEAYRLGAVGFVSGSANFLPKDYVALEHELKTGGDRAGELQASIDQAVARSSGPNSIVRIKSALAETIPGYPLHVRPPLSSG